MKNQFQDIIPPDRRSIRNIPIPARKADEKAEPKSAKAVRIKKIQKEPVEEEIIAEEREEVLEISREYEREEEKAPKRAARTKKRGSSRTFLWSATVIAVAVLFFTITGLFKSAAVEVTEKSAGVTLAGTYLFSLSPVGGEAGYSAITVTDSATAVVPATGEKQVSAKASGAVVIYNNGSNESQRLVAGTRLETPSGLIFKLDSAVTVPAMKKSGTKTVPGSVEAQVTAEKPGSDYNIPLSDFTIPGFKGTPRYNSFYARSKSPMAGGNVGTIATIDDASLSATVEGLKKQLYSALKQKASKQLPAAQKTFDGFEKVTYTVSDPLPGSDAEAGKAVIKVEGSAKIYAIDLNSFARVLLAKAGINASNTESFGIDFEDTLASFGNESSTTLSATFEGKASVIWNVDTESFKKAIAGHNVSEIASIAPDFPEIDRVSVTVKPFSFFDPKIPKSTEKIKITTKI